MGYINKISNHKGTEFKHRVGFRQARVDQKSKMRLSVQEVGTVSVPPSELKKSDNDPLVVRMISAIVILVICGGIGWLFYLTVDVLL